MSPGAGLRALKWKVWVTPKANTLLIRGLSGSPAISAYGIVIGRRLSLRSLGRVSSAAGFWGSPLASWNVAGDATKTFLSRRAWAATRHLKPSPQTFSVVGGSSGKGNAGLCSSPVRQPACAAAGATAATLIDAASTVSAARRLRARGRGAAALCRDVMDAS